MVRLSEWITSLQAGQLDGEFGPSSDLIQAVAESLIHIADGLEGMLLSKSLQEALFYSVGFDTDISYTQFKSRFTHRVNRQGAPSFIRLFLSIYFFNFVWFETGESFRSLASSSDSFAKDMEGVERICQKVVASTWNSFEESGRLLDLSAAEELVRSVEGRLRGIAIPDKG